MIAELHFGGVALLHEPDSVLVGSQHPLLDRLNFSDLEIEIFCSRYDKDGDFTFNADEINAINQGLGDQIANYDHLVLNEENDEQEEEEPAEKIPKMNKTQFGE